MNAALKKPFARWSTPEAEFARRYPRLLRALSAYVGNATLAERYLLKGARGEMPYYMIVRDAIRKRHSTAPRSASRR